MAETKPLEPELVENLTEDEIADFKEAFSLFDRDNDGTITTRDLENILNSLGETPSEFEIQGWISEVDPNGNGKIELKDFLTIMATQLKDSGSEKHLRAAFKVFDKDGTGFITAAELRQVLTTRGEPLTDHEVELMIREAESTKVNKDGNIDYEDFITRMFWAAK